MKRRRLRIRPALVLVAALFMLGSLAAPAQAQESSGDAPPPDVVGCEVDYSLNQWGTGFAANVTVRNTGTVPVHWAVRIVYGPDTTVTQVTGVIVAQHGNIYWFEPIPSWNVPIPPGQSATFGIIGLGSGVPESVKVFCWSA